MGKDAEAGMQPVGSEPVEAERHSFLGKMMRGGANRHSRGSLTDGPVSSSLRNFAIPLAVSFLVNMIYSWIDKYFVSKLGASAIAAVGISEQLGFFIFNFGSGFAIGTGILIARRIGEGNKKGANDAATQAVMVMLFFSLALMGALMLALPKVIAGMGLEGDVAHYAYLYLSALAIGIPGNFLMFQINAIVRSTGNSVFALMVLLSTTVVNAILAPLLIFGYGPFPALGMTGAGLATALAQIFGAVLSFIGLMKNDVGIKVVFSRFRFDRDIVKKIVMLSIPASLQMFSVSVSRIGLFKIANDFGTDVMAAYTLGISVDLFAFMSVFAMGVAVEVATGQNLGAGKVERVFQYHKSAIRQLFLIMLGLAVAVFFAGGRFAAIFTQDPAIIKATQDYLHMTVFGYIFFSIGVICTRVISGAGAAFRSMAIVAGCLLFIQLPLAYVLSNHTPLREQGIWAGVTGSYIILALVGLQQLYSRKWLKATV